MSRTRGRLWVGLLTAVMSTTLATPVAAATYSIESITANRQSSEPVVVVDADGDRHVAFTVVGAEAGIHYATNASGSWTDIAIPGTAGDHRPSIALDPSGSPAIAWSLSTGGVGYASLANGWTIETVSAEPGDAEASLAFDAAGGPHIAMRLGVVPPFGFGLGLFYASPDGGGGWTVEQLTSFEYDRDPWLAIDASGRAHIGYNNGGDQLTYLSNPGGVWSSVFVAGGGVRHLSLALDTSGNPRAVISMPGDGTYLVTPDGDPLVDPWSLDLIAEGYHDVPSLAIDSTGADHVAYRDGNSGGAAVAAKVAGTWTSVAVGGGSVEHVSLAIDPAADRPVLASDPTETQPDSGIVVSTQAADGTWSDAQVSSDAIDRLPSLAIDASGGEHLLFDRLGTAPGVYYGSKVGGSWQLERIATAREVAATSLAMAPDGSAHALYTTVGVDTDQLALTYATNRGGSWTSQVIATVGGVLIGRELAVGSDGSPLVPYVGFGRRQALNLVTFGPRRTTTKVIERGGFYAAPGIAVDSAGHVHLAYQNGNQLSYATNASGHWTIQAVPGGDVALGTAAIAADASGRPSIAITDFQTHEPHVFRLSSGTWTDDIVSPGGSLGFASTPSIEVDGAAREIAFIAVGDDPNLARVYRATDRSGDWVVDDVALAAGAFSASIGVESGGTVGIVYANGPSLDIARG